MLIAVHSAASGMMVVKSWRMLRRASGAPYSAAIRAQ